MHPCTAAERRAVPALRRATASPPRRRRVSLLLFAVLAVAAAPPLAGQGSRPPLDLTGLSLEDLMNVEISTPSKRIEGAAAAPGVVTVITAEEIADFGAVNLFELLNRAPSVFMTGSFLLPQNRTSIRGELLTAFDLHVLLLVNGRPFREFTQGGVHNPFYLAFPLAAVERIEIVRGPGSVLYGTNAFSGVINLVTKEASDPPALDLAAGAGGFGARFGSASGGRRFGDVEVVFAARAFEEDGPLLSATDPAGVTDSAHFGDDSAGLFARLDYKGLSVNTFLATAEQEHFGPFPFWPAGVFDADAAFVDLGYDTSLTDVWSLEAHLTRNRVDHAFPFDLPPQPPPPGSGEVETGSESLLFEVTARAALGEDLNLLLGAVGDRRSGGSSSGILDIIPDYEEVWWSGYTQVDYRPAPLVKLVGGLQWNRREGGSSDVVPRGGAIFTFSPHWGLKLLYAEAFRAPTAVETSIDAGVFVGNPDLDPEKVATAEAQILYHRERSQVALTLFHSELRDLVRRVPSATPGRITNGNVAREMFDGLEVEGRYSFSPRLYLLGSLTHQESEDHTGAEDVTAVPNTMVKAGASWVSESGVRVSLFDTFFDTPNNVTGLAGPNPPAEAVHLLTGHLSVDLSRFLRRQASPRLLFELHGVNLLDEEVHVPEFVLGGINTLPQQRGSGVYGELRLSF